MKIFITGSAGFIGTHLRERLESEGHTVIGLDNMSHPCNYAKNPEIMEDVEHIDNFPSLLEGCDWIVHLAAQINVEKSIEDPYDSLITNTIGTYKVLETATKLGIPVIYASSSEIYGDRLTDKMSEDHPMIPKSPYAASKMGADGLCHAFFHSFRTKAIIVRNFNTFGKYQSDDKWGAVIAKFADKIKKGESPIIFGDGTQKRDFMYYTDAIDFYMLCINGKAKFGEEYNVGFGKSVSINKLAEKMIDISEKNITSTHIEPRPGEVKDFVCNNKKAKLIGWKPKINLEEGLKQYMGWKKRESR